MPSSAQRSQHCPAGTNHPQVGRQEGSVGHDLALYPATDAPTPTTPSNAMSPLSPVCRTRPQTLQGICLCRRGLSAGLWTLQDSGKSNKGTLSLREGLIVAEFLWSYCKDDFASVFKILCHDFQERTSVHGQAMVLADGHRQARLRHRTYEHCGCLACKPISAATKVFCSGNPAPLLRRNSAWKVIHTRVAASGRATLFCMAAGLDPGHAELSLEHESIAESLPWLRQQALPVRSTEPAARPFTFNSARSCGRSLRGPAHPDLRSLRSGISLNGSGWPG